MNATMHRAEKWDRVTRHEPCPVCEHDGFCKVSPDRMIIGCMRVKEGSYRTVPTALGDMYLHRLTDEPREAPTPRPKPTSAPARDIMADRAVYALVVTACAALPDFAEAELVRRFGPRGPQIAAARRLGYCDGPALLAAIEAAGRRRDAIAAGVLNRDGAVSPSLLGRLVIPYLRGGTVYDLRGAGIKGRDETKELSLRGGYAERGVDDLFYNDDALGQLGADATLHLCGGAYKTMALIEAGIVNAVGLRGEAELGPGHIERLRAAGVRTIIRHIDAEDPKEGQDLSAGRRLGLMVAERLAAAGFAVQVAEPPREPGTAKVDPDSLLRDFGPAMVRAYAAGALPLAAWRVAIGVEAPGVPAAVAAEIETLQQRLRQAEQLQVAMMHVHRNKRIRAEKPTLLATAFLYNSAASRGRVGEDGWLHTTRAAIGDIGGVSPDAAGDHLDRITTWDVGIHKQVRHEEVRQVDADGQVIVERRKHIYIKVDGKTADVLMPLGGDFTPPRPIDKKTGEEKDTWGGKRTPCPVCKSQRRVKIVACADCGHEFDRKIEEPPVDTPLPDGDAPITPADLRAERVPDERAADAPSVPPTPIAVPPAPASYPPGRPVYAREAEAEEGDDWDPYECNHRGCVRPVVIGQRYCGQHRHLGLAPDAPPVPPPVARRPSAPAGWSGTHACADCGGTCYAQAGAVPRCLPRARGRPEDSWESPTEYDGDDLRDDGG